MKRIGVLGGMSAQATMDFEARVHHAARRLLPQHWNHRVLDRPGEECSGSLARLVPATGYAAAVAAGRAQRTEAFPYE